MIKDAPMLKKAILALCPVLALSLGAARLGHAEADKKAAAPAPAAPKADKAAPAATAPAAAKDKAAAKDAPAASKEKTAAKVAPAAGEVTLAGDMTCAKCGLHESAACQNVLKVKEGGKDVKYYMAKNAVADANHEKVCSTTAHATVTGKVSEEGGKKVITPSAVKID